MVPFLEVHNVRCFDAQSHYCRASKDCHATTDAISFPFFVDVAVGITKVGRVGAP